MSKYVKKRPLRNFFWLLPSLSVQRLILFITISLMLLVKVCLNWHKESSLNFLLKLIELINFYSTWKSSESHRISMISRETEVD